MTAKLSLPALIDEAHAALAAARTFDELAAVRDRAKAIQRMAKGVKGARDAFNRCGEIVIEALAIEGRELAKLDKAKGGWPNSRFQWGTARCAHTCGTWHWPEGVDEGAADSGDPSRPVASAS